MDKQQILMANMHVFNIAARELSFTKAASYLNMSQSAVSHRIKNLEQQLGFKLFIRLTRKLELTPEGIRLKMAVSQSFDAIYSELNDIKHNELSGELFIGTSNNFAASWLIPRLTSFQKRYPNLDVRIQVKDSIHDFRYEPIDLAIYYIKPNHPDLHTELLFNENLIPVCSPQYAQQLGLIEKGIKGLKEATFIHRTQSKAWPRWLTANNSDIDCYQKTYSFNQSNLYITAAINSLGIAIGRQQLIEKPLASGQLVTPFSAIPSDLNYYIACMKGMEERPKYLAFKNWLQEQINM
ncbi:LysR substrate-binding domain-containing protein [Photobacterium angustum]|uniref:LysR substrate-binding domain-containing protein n=1 Tax=Photobacterium angustum TaxID=661 RepID=UPI0005DDEB7D|nr:LysR substrate-binding domain-containing protein [Photobacterium angustum]KJG02018.1 LysR family transcriptional regulator [Photobacterium angustum]PSV69690.1 LysR family transcriptional regulator [Photobacterium angustum]